MYMYAFKKKIGSYCNQFHPLSKKEQIAAVTHDKYARQKLLNDIPSF